MESPGKYKENETNRDLLQSTVQKLSILREKKHSNSDLQLSFFSVFFSSQSR